jgi:YVTN family beta-propeller protein
MKVVGWLSLLRLASNAVAQPAPWQRADIPVSSHDRVYAADQTSNTVSVIDPSSNRLLGVIKLGESVPGAVSRLLPYVERLHLAGRVRAFQDSYGAR